MQSRPMVLILFALLATAAAAVFLAISLDSAIYAPGANDGGRETRILAPIAHRVPKRFAHDVTPRLVLRKTYSVIAFAIVGLLCAPLVPPNRRTLVCGLLIAGFSLIIEIAQRATVSHESNLSSVFDVACGALGGIIGALVWNPLSRRFPRLGNL